VTQIKRTRRPSRVRTALFAAVPLIAAGAAGPMIGLAFRFPGFEWVFLALGALLLGIAVVFQVRAKLKESRESTARERFKLRLRDEAMPFLTTAAEMARLPFDERAAFLKPVALQAVALLRGLVEVDRSRANVYVLDLDQAELQMVSIARSGRGERPKPFVAGTERGDSALEFMQGQATTYFPDLDEEAPAGFVFEGHDYGTLVSVPIWTDAGAYGMVTLDAPKAGSLTPGDVALVEAVAEMMTIPFEIAQDGTQESRRASTD
jgi:hypothetical protein